MPSNVEVQCANPNEMRLKVAVELSIGEWREVLKRTDGVVAYYGPLNNVLLAIQRGIRGIEERVGIDSNQEGT